MCTRSLCVSVRSEESFPRDNLVSEVSIGDPKRTRTPRCLLGHGRFGKVGPKAVTRGTKESQCCVERRRNWLQKSETFEVIEATMNGHVELVFQEETLGAEEEATTGSLNFFQKKNNGSRISV